MNNFFEFLTLRWHQVFPHPGQFYQTQSSQVCWMSSVCRVREVYTSAHAKKQDNINNAQAGNLICIDLC